MASTARKHKFSVIRLLQKDERFHIIALLISGAIAGSVFSFSVSAWLLPLLLVPFVRYFSSKDMTLRRSLIMFASFHIPFNGVVLSWFLAADVSDVAGISTSTALIASILCWVIMTIVLTVCFSPLILVRHKLQNAVSPLFAGTTLLLLPASWVIGEWLRSVGFSLFLYGNGATIGDYWNFGSLGLAMIQSPFADLSTYVGMYGLSFLVVLAAVFINLILTGPARKLPAIGLGVLILLGIVPGALKAGRPASTVDETRHASVLQIAKQTPDFFGSTPIENEQPEQKDLIVLPEYSSVFIPAFHEFANNYVNSRLNETGFSVNVSEGRQVIWEEWFGTLEFRDNNGNLIDTHTKELLIPTGEYMPGVLTNFYNLTGQQYVVDNYNASRKVEKGAPPRVFQGYKMTIGPVACSGILGRDIYRTHAQNGAEVFTNSASLLLFNQSESYFRQSMMMAKFHAVANSRTYIQSSKGAPAFVIDQNGDFIISPTDISNKFIDFSFPVNRSKTFYTKVGEWPLWLSALILLMVAVKPVNSVVRNLKQPKIRKK